MMNRDCRLERFFIAIALLASASTAEAQTGACCLGSGTCVNTDPAGCSLGAGEFLGAGTSCAPNICLGACCTANKGCIETYRDYCTTVAGSAPGDFRGAGTTCDLNCPSHLGTGFIYQGQLKRGGVPLTGAVDLKFSLWTTAEGGVQVGFTQNLQGVDVANGLFSVDLDFGQNAFNGNARWLQIKIHDHADPPGAFTTLSPRQPLTPTPYALQTRGIVVTDDGNVGIGTTSPQQLLHVNGGLRWGGTTTDFAYSDKDGSGLFLEQKGSSSATSKIRVQTSKSGDRSNYSQFFIDPDAGFSFMNIGTGNSNVGIGTITPQASLDVRGDIRLGPSGQFRATGGEENLRIVRGVINFDGTIRSGSGFQVSTPSDGAYIITFNTPFAGVPTLTATPLCFGTEVILYAAGVTSNRANVAALLRQGGSFASTDFNFIAIGPR